MDSDSSDDDIEVVDNEEEDDFVLLRKKIKVTDEGDMYMYMYTYTYTYPQDQNDSKWTWNDVDANNTYQGFFHIFSLEEHLQDIWKSYSCSYSKLLHQVEVDFPRQKIVIDNKHCSSLKEFSEFLSVISHNRGIASHTLNSNKNSKKWTVDSKSGEMKVNIIFESLDILVMLLITQTAHFFQYNYLYKMYADAEKERHLIHDKSNINKTGTEINEIEIYNTSYDNNLRMKITHCFQLIELSTMSSRQTREIISSVFIDISQKLSVLAWIISN